MAVRLAAETDIAAIIEMGIAFVGELPYGDTDPATAGPRITRVFGETLKHGAVLVSEDEQGLTGMLALVFMDHPLVGTRMAFEVAWWVEPRARKGTAAGRLVKAAISMAKQLDCKRIQFGAPNRDVARLYEKLEMVPIETTFIKEL